ncbi:hypothetical protein [Methanothrix soehngenii]|uniref:hypothetical protein n=1 Tax=Methanothrix soehngenii TaxID=2223 RepID=UPI00300C721C
MDRMDRSCIAGDHTDTSFFYTLECFQDVVVTLSDCSYGNTATNVSTIEFSPLLFGSLFTKTPREEFSLLIDALSYDKKILSNLNVGTMLERWGLEDVADKQFHQLSGGYRKYVLVATQVEALKNNGHVVAINIQQQLDIHAV